MGQLHDWDAWAQQLPQEVVTELAAWLAHEPIELHHRGWFSEGRSGEPVARVMRKPDANTRGLSPDQRVVKFFSKGSETRVANIRRASREAGGFREHIAAVDDLRIPLSNWNAVFLHIAGGDLRAFQPLTKFFSEREFPGYCATIMSSIVGEWNENRVLPENRTVVEVLNEVMGRRRHDVMLWADKHGVIDGAPRRMNWPGWPRPLPNPFVLVTGTEGERTIEDVLVGKAHGDLSGRNILIRETSPVDPGSYVLIDCDRYSERAALTRDPMHLLVAMVLDHFTECRSWTQEIAKVLVAPDTPGTSPFVDHIQNISAAIRTSAPPIVQENWGAEWRRQCLLSLVGVGLVHLGRNLRPEKPDEAEDAKAWCFYLAALAAEAYLDARPDGESAAAKPSPT